MDSPFAHIDNVRPGTIRVWSTGYGRACSVFVDDGEGGMWEREIGSTDADAMIKAHDAYASVTSAQWS